VNKNRRVRVTLQLGERVSANVAVRRGSAVLARKAVARLAAGRRTITVVVPKRVATGRAVVRITLQDNAGNRLVLQRRVTIPRA
jgi:hypothetical protein